MHLKQKYNFRGFKVLLRHTHKNQLGLKLQSVSINVCTLFFINNYTFHIVYEVSEIRNPVAKHWSLSGGGDPLTFCRICIHFLKSGQSSS